MRLIKTIIVFLILLEQMVIVEILYIYFNWNILKLFLTKTVQILPKTSRIRKAPESMFLGACDVSHLSCLHLLCVYLYCIMFTLLYHQDIFHTPSSRM